jgi:hypothetical protein
VQGGESSAATRARVCSGSRGGEIALSPVSRCSHSPFCLSGPRRDIGGQACEIGEIASDVDRWEDGYNGEKSKPGDRRPVEPRRPRTPQAGALVESQLGRVAARAWQHVEPGLQSDLTSRNAVRP